MRSSVDAARSVVESRTPSVRGDEVSPILEFVIREMVFNASSQHADRIREYNVMARQDCHAEYEKLSGWARAFGGADFLESCQHGKASARFLASGEWSWLVRAGGVWDHRRHIRETFRPAEPEALEQPYHHYKGFLYFHDIWSHIHYGYVGKACGFTNAELLDGLGLEPRAASISGRLRVHCDRDEAVPVRSDDVWHPARHPGRTGPRSQAARGVRKPRGARGLRPYGGMTRSQACASF
jgi:putative RNase toxin 44 of polymorphic toxin system